ncbi:hypothetical protein E4U50_000815 [Claviceps purpurea]|nr:hypothetical protein E4U50_000815 [Claviceps purpurea]
MSRRNLTFTARQSNSILSDAQPLEPLYSLATGLLISDFPATLLALDVLPRELGIRLRTWTFTPHGGLTVTYLAAPEVNAILSAERAERAVPVSYGMYKSSNLFVSGNNILSSPGSPFNLRRRRSSNNTFNWGRRTSYQRRITRR